MGAVCTTAVSIKLRDQTATSFGHRIAEKFYCFEDWIDMRTKGKILSWNDQKGYGFIAPRGGGKQVFIHIRAFRNRNRRPEAGQVVTYALSVDKQGRQCAAQATLPGDRHSQRETRPNGMFSIISATAFMLFVGAAAVTSKVPMLIFAVYALVSLVTFFVYAMDKSAAENGTWRTAESTLHLLALVGGWPGAVVAQHRLRHKSRKQSFRAVFWVTVLVNCGMFVWVLTPAGGAMLRSLVSAVA